MSTPWLSVKDLAHQIGRDARDIEKLVQRGRIPGRKINGEWQFHPQEVTRWLETEIPDATSKELTAIEVGQAPSDEVEQFRLTNYLTIDTIAVPLEARTKRSVLETLLEVAGRTWQVWAPARVLEAIIDRENALPTNLGNGIAIPHPRNPMPDDLGQTVVSFGRTYSAVPFGGGGQTMPSLFFMVLSRDTPTHLRILARLGRMMQVDGFIDTLGGLETPEEVFDYLSLIDAKLG